MGTVWGCAGSSKGFVELGRLPVWYKGSVYEEFDGAPSFGAVLFFPLSKDIESTHCQSTGGSSVNATPSSYFLAFTATLNLLFLLF